MSTLLKRYFTYLLIPAGLVLLLLPLNTHRTEQADRDFVFLRINETLVEEAITKPESVPPANTSNDKSMQALNEQLDKMQKLFSEDTTIANPYGYPILDAGDLTTYPALHEAVEEMMRMIALQQQMRSSLKRLDHVSTETWGRFEELLFSDSGAASFQYGNRIFRGHVVTSRVLVDVEVEHLKLTAKILGGVFLLLGFFVLRGLYVPASVGIQVGKRTGMIMWDVIVIGLGVIFTWGLLDSMLAKYFQTSSQFGDVQMAAYMGFFWLLFASPVMALFTTTTGLQSVLITRQGISVNGLFGVKTLNWSAVENIRLAEFYSARRIQGFFAPRKLAKILEVSGKSVILRIMEPPYSSTKKEILNTLTTYAPEELKESISGLSRQWLSVW